MSVAADGVTRELRAVASRLLLDDEVSAVVGYGAATWGLGTRPVFVTAAETTDRLVWNRYCVANLMVYLTRPDVIDLGRLAVVAKGCDIRSLVVLLQEHQVERNQVVVLGVGCDGMQDPAREDGDLLPKCHGCRVRTPPLYDHLVGGESLVGDAPTAPSPVAAVEAMTRAERWGFWTSELARCIRCYACRAVCPQCYCERCFVDVTRPSWTSASHSPHANLVFHLIRAQHLAGRCVGCGECARACPQDIPLGVLNAKAAAVVSQHWGHHAGMDLAAEPPLLHPSTDDTEDFIR